MSILAKLNDDYARMNAYCFARCSADLIGALIEGLSEPSFVSDRWILKFEKKQILALLFR